MKFILKLFLLMLLLGEAGMFLSAAEDKKLTLISNGKSDYVIVIPDKDPQNKVEKAGKLLQSILMESTKCKLPIVKESAVPANTNHIYLGKTKAAEKAGIPFDKLIEWTFCKRVIGKDIYLVGNDASANFTGGLTHREREYLMQTDDHRLNLDIKDLSYKGFRGTYKAVSSFLEKQAGVRFLLPGSAGLHVPEHKVLKVSASINYLGSARFPFCYGRCYGDITIPNNHNEIPYYKSYGGHSWQVAVPMHIYAKDHPEYFVMVNGKRRPDYGPGGGNHLCISNPEVHELLMKELEREYDRGFKWIQVAQTDGIIHCQCDKCKAISEKYGYGDAIWQVYLKIAKEMKKRRPDLKIVFLAYSVAAYAPKSFDSLPDNVILDMTAYDKEFFDQWAKFKVPKLVYIYNWGEYHTTIFCPKRSLKFLAKQLRMFDKNHVKGIYKCSFGETIGLDGPAYYVFSKLLEDPNQDPQKIADDFYSCAYGKAFSPMKSFFDAVYERLDFNDGSSVIDLLFVNPRNPQLQISFIFQPDLMVYLEKLLKHATRCAENPKVKARIKLVKREFDYLKNLIQIYTYYNAYDLSRSKEAVELLDQALIERDEMLDSWYDKDGKMIQEPGIDWPFFYNVPKKIVREGGGFICNPFPGLLPRMPSIRKSVGLPPEKPVKKKLSVTTKAASGEKACNAVFLRPEAVKTFSAAGKGVAIGTFGEPRKEVSFKVSYDKENLYFAFSCRFPAINKAKFVPNDGPSYKCREGVGIFLSPSGSMSNYYHFFLTAAPDSPFESRYGFINDKLHPYYGKEDESWDGKWEYASKVYQQKDLWTARATIPFKTLGVKPPQPGEKWRMEIMRRHFPAGADNPAGVDMSSWTSNFDDIFCNPRDFGTLDFK